MSSSEWRMVFSSVLWLIIRFTILESAEITLGLGFSIMGIEIILVFMELCSPYGKSIALR